MKKGVEVEFVDQFKRSCLEGLPLPQRLEATGWDGEVEWTITCRPENETEPYRVAWSDGRVVDCYRLGKALELTMGLRP